MKSKLSNLLNTLKLIYASTFAKTANVSNRSVTDIEYARSIVLTKRLEQINEMDKSSLTRNDKKDLRREVKAIKRQQSHGISISIGVATTIVLLLILHQ